MLRKRPRADDLVADQRRMSNSRGRIVYLGLLVLLALAVLNFLFGDYLFMRADGLVVRDRHSLETTYLARIDSVAVKEGQSVSRGDPLFTVQSSQMLEQLADLSARNADLAAKATEFKIRAETVSDLLPLAIKRERETEKVLTRFDSLADARLLTTARYDEALRARFDARESMVKLEAEEQALKPELAALEAARKDAQKALSDLREHYGEGVLRSPVDGSVGAVVPSSGDVYEPGESILTVYSGEPYILTYLPRRYLFPIREGLKVSVTSGRVSATGTVTRILPVTDTLPKEFQNTFRPQDRNQLARIEFDGTPPFPVHEKIQVSRKFF